MFCDKCGKKIKHAGTFCEKCKENVSTDGFLKIDLDKLEKIVSKPMPERDLPRSVTVSEHRNKTNNYWLIGGLAAVSCAVVVIVCVFLFGGNDKSGTGNIYDGKSEKNQIIDNHDKEYEKFIDVTDDECKVDGPQSAYECLRMYGKYFGYKIEADEKAGDEAAFDIPESYTDEKENKYYRFQRLYKSIPVYGHEMIVVADNEYDVIDIHGSCKKMAFEFIMIDKKLENVMSDKEKAKKTASDMIAQKYDMKVIGEPELVIYEDLNNKYVLVWCADICGYDNDKLMDKRVFVDAENYEEIKIIENNLVYEVDLLKTNPDEGKKYTYKMSEDNNFVVCDKISNDYTWFYGIEDIKDGKKGYEEANEKTDINFKDKILKCAENVQNKYIENLSIDESNLKNRGLVSIYIEDTGETGIDDWYYLKNPKIICLQIDCRKVENQDFEKNIEKMISEAYAYYLVDLFVEFNDSDMRKTYADLLVYLLEINEMDNSSRLYTSVKSIVDNKEKEKRENVTGRAGNAEIENEIKTFMSEYKNKLAELFFCSLYMLTPESGEEESRTVVVNLAGYIETAESVIINTAFENTKEKIEKIKPIKPNKTKKDGSAKPEETEESDSVKPEETVENESTKSEKPKKNSVYKGPTDVDNTIFDNVSERIEDGEDTEESLEKDSQNDNT